MLAYTSRPCSCSSTSCTEEVMDVRKPSQQYPHSTPYQLSFVIRNKTAYNHSNNMCKERAPPRILRKRHKRPCVTRLLLLRNRNWFRRRCQGRETSITRRSGWIDNTVSTRPVGYVFIVIVSVPIGRVEDVD